MTEKRERCIKKEMERERKIKDGKTEIKDGWEAREREDSSRHSDKERWRN